MPSSALPSGLTVVACATAAVLAGPPEAPAKPRHKRLSATAEGRLVGSTLSFRLTRSSLGRGRGTGDVSRLPDTTLVLRLRGGRLRARAVLRIGQAPATSSRPAGSVLAVSGSARITGGTGRFRGARGRFTMQGTEQIYTGAFTARLRGSLVV
jgi:hypothetical protein